MKNNFKITLAVLFLTSIFIIIFLYSSNKSTNFSTKTWKRNHDVKSKSCLKTYPFPKLDYLPNDKLSDYKEDVQKMGVHPVKNIANLHSVIKKQKLVPVPMSNWAYALKIKNREMRYVVPRTRELLYQISKEFKQKISKTDLFQAKLKVTSLFRLKDNNPTNSSTESAHKYGCAIDISYIEFLNEYNQPLKLDGCQLEFLQFALEKVIEELQAKKKLYKTKEFGATSKCFHIVPKS